ncbi:MAG TPA: hypothetical protein VMH81_13685 [Bryobacteraceae bacterium]|nr:hypothetical protein [Bryobacteraceae bacterium]
MDEMTIVGEPVPAEAAMPYIELGKWMGRRDAFGQMAGRCSAAEIESLRQIHDGKLYQRLNCTWDEFCAQHLKVSSKTVERELANLRRFGPLFFTLRQLARISPREYATIADCIDEQGVRWNGSTIALDPENSAEVAGAVKALLEEHGPGERVAPRATFNAAMARFRAASGALCAFQNELDDDQAYAMGLELEKLLSTAAAWGVQLHGPRRP